jgi:hypothetical protein
LVNGTAGKCDVLGSCVPEVGMRRRLMASDCPNKSFRLI